MIGFLSGKIQTKLSDSIIVLVGGVGYRVLVTPSLYVSLKISSPINLHIYTHVREDTLDLYGFKTLEELSLFNMLLGVPGIGPKTALLVVDRGVEPVKNAISKASVDFFTLIPRLGHKNSQKIIIEFRNKLGSVTDLDLSVESKEIQETVEALCVMGYSKAEAMSRLKGVPPEATIEEKIRYALRNTDTKRKA